jgi:hypothetical protein
MWRDIDWRRTAVWSRENDRFVINPIHNHENRFKKIPISIPAIDRAATQLKKYKYNFNGKPKI